MRYTEENRGKIHCPELKRQLVDYSGIRFGNITPTDIDGFIEYQDCMYAFIEIKRECAVMPKGQRVAFTNLVDAVEGSAKWRHAVLFVCRHGGGDGDINAVEMEVSSYYACRNWYDGNGRKLDELIGWLKGWCDRDRVAHIPMPLIPPPPPLPKSC